MSKSTRSWKSKSPIRSWKNKRSGKVSFGKIGEGIKKVRDYIAKLFGKGKEISPKQVELIVEAINNDPKTKKEIDRVARESEHKNKTIEEQEKNVEVKVYSEMFLMKIMRMKAKAYEKEHCFDLFKKKISLIGTTNDRKAFLKAFINLLETKTVTEVADILDKYEIDPDMYRDISIDEAEDILRKIK